MARFLRPVWGRPRLCRRELRRSAPRNRTKWAGVARSTLLAPPGAGREAGFSPEPTGEIVGVVESGLHGGFADGVLVAQRALCVLETELIPHSSQAKAVVAFQTSGKGIASISGLPGNRLKRSRFSQAAAHALKQGRGLRRCRGRRSMRFEQPGDDGDDGRVVREGGPALGRHARQQGVEFIQGMLRQAAVAGPSCLAGRVIVKHEAKRAAVSIDRKAVWDAGRYDE